MIDLVFQAMADVEITNNQLESAKKALIEKDKEIANLKKQLANQISSVIADAEKDKKIKELEEQLTIVKNVNEEWKKIHVNDQVRNTKLEHALKDLEGTLCGASDHFKELSNSVHKIFE